MSKDHNQDLQHTKRVPIHREGVVYTPSGQIPDDIALTRKITTPQTSVKKRKAPKKAPYSIFLVTTVFVGVLMFVLLGFLLFNEFFDDDGFTGRPQTPGSDNGIVTDALPTPTPYDPPPVPGTESTSGLIWEINRNTNRIDLYIVESSLMRSFFVEPHSRLHDRFGSVITFAGFSVGDVIEIDYLSGTTTIERARVSAQVLTYSNIHDVAVNTDTNELQIGNRRYRFSQRTVVRYHGAAMDIAAIHPVDVVTVSVFQEMVVNVDVHRSNGIIHIPANDLIVDGVVEIGTAAHVQLAPNMDVRVAEGDHRVVIRGANIEPFIYDVTVERGGVSTISFDGLEMRAGTLIVNIEDPYAVLTIDGEVRLTNETIALEFGTYTVSVQREGFVPFSQDVEIGGTPVELNVSLAEMVRTRNIMIITSPPGARVYLDGEFMGISPVAATMEMRRYSLSLALAGFVGVSLDVWITEESDNVLPFPLVPDVTNPPTTFE